MPDQEVIAVTPANLKTTMAALAAIATPANLLAAPATAMSASPAPAPIASAAPQRAAPRASDPGFSWDEVVSEMNAQAGLCQPQAAAPIASLTHQATAAPMASYPTGAIDWSATVAAVNAENGCSHPGANPDPKLVAMLAREMV